MSDVLTVRNLTVRYPNAPRPSVQGVSFTVPARGSVALVGESGSGKSTTALAVTRLLDPAVEVTADEVSFEGRDLLRMGKKELRALRRGGLGMVFQDPRASWNPARTIERQLLDGLRGAERAERRERLVARMRRIGLDDPERRMRDYPHHFSGGMLQRALLAGVLVHEPRLLIADEPTSALDTTVQAELLALIGQLRTEQGLSMLLISHDLGVVARMSDHVLVLYAGRIAEQGPTSTVLAQPQHPYTRDLLAAIPRLHGPRKVPLQVGRVAEARTEGCPYAGRCRFATDRCRTETPAPRRVGGTEVACHLAPLPDAKAA
ncbi:MAG: ABC transporter ATP-binding protein [Solirubrobacteraceae bacterium]|nr:ABC transporter ATP-binding protein [Solirubrobacteraceae bacterium]